MNYVDCLSEPGCGEFRVGDCKIFGIPNPITGVDTIQKCQVIHQPTWCLKLGVSVCKTLFFIFQDICDLIDSCQFYVYRKDTYLCNIYDQSFEISECHATAGPHEPAITSCSEGK